MTLRVRISTKTHTQGPQGADSGPEAVHALRHQHQNLFFYLDHEVSREIPVWEPAPAGTPELLGVNPKLCTEPQPRKAADNNSTLVCFSLRVFVVVVLIIIIILLFYSY